jgi:anti-sigma factor RsiW
MDPDLTDQEIEDLLAAYAIGAVDEDERAIVDRYVATHPEAAAEVQAFRHAAAMLAFTGGPVPEGVWGSLAPALANRRPALESPAGVVPIRRQRSQFEPIADSQTGRGPSPVRWLASAAVAALLIVGVLIASVVASDSGDDLAREPSVAAAASAARNQPGAREATLRAPNGMTIGDVVMLPNGRAYLSSDLPVLNADRTYQLWALHGTDRLSLGVIGRNPHVVAFRITGSPWGIAVTDEVSGGVKVSHQTPVAVGDMQIT